MVRKVQVGFLVLLIFLGKLGRKFLRTMLYLFNKMSSQGAPPP